MKRFIKIVPLSYQNPKIQGINAGRGSDLQMFRQMVTKFENGTIKNVSTETAVKMMTGSFYEYGVVPSSIIGNLGLGDYMPSIANEGNLGANTSSGSYK